MKQLLDLEKEVIVFMGEAGLTRPFPMVSPEQLRGTKINDYAHELAQTTVWIGYIQWLRDNGFGHPSEPILKPLDTIRQMDAILAFDEQGRPLEPQWPEAEVIIGNPPFLGTKKLRTQLGNTYVESLFKLYEGRIPGFSDLVCYWFEKARAQIELSHTRRAGLLSTQGIRGGLSRTVLDRIKQSGDIFMAWSDRDWVLDGANVHVSMVGFDAGKEIMRELDGTVVTAINSNLTGSTDLTQARRLPENAGIAFVADVKGGAFDIDAATAQQMLMAKGNPNGRPNSDVVRPWVNGLDITRRPRNVSIIDFGVMPEEAAALYEMPFEYVKKYVYPARSQNRKTTYARRWWIHAEPCLGMREALRQMSRFIVTPTVSKHRLFVWLEHPTLPDHQLIAVACSDDYFFGVLHSTVHELWARGLGTQVREAESGFRYTPSTTFETFPFPWPPGCESKEDPRVEAIAQAARELVEKRDRWLNPEGADEATLKKCTLTNLYNERPTWLDHAHRKLDHAVLDAYGWPHDLGDEEILSRLLALNLQRAAAGDSVGATHTDV